MFTLIIPCLLEFSDPHLRGYCCCSPVWKSIEFASLLSGRYFGVESRAVLSWPFLKWTLLMRKENQVLVSFVLTLCHQTGKLTLCKWPQVKLCNKSRKLLFIYWKVHILLTSNQAETKIWSKDVVVQWRGGAFIVYSLSRVCLHDGINEPSSEGEAGSEED